MIPGRESKVRTRTILERYPISRRRSIHLVEYNDMLASVLGKYAVGIYTPKPRGDTSLTSQYDGGDLREYMKKKDAEKDFKARVRAYEESKPKPKPKRVKETA